MRLIARPITLCLACIGLALATSVALAWSVARWSPVPQHPRTRFGAFERWGRVWDVAGCRRFGVVDVWWGDLACDGTPLTPKSILAALTRPAPGHAELLANRHERLAEFARERASVRIVNEPPGWGTFAQPEPPPGGITVSGADRGFGWPWPCLWYRCLGRFNRIDMSVTTVRLEHAYWASGGPSPRSTDYHAIPLRAIWPNLAANTAVFACGWAAALVLPVRLRRAVRERRGRCPRCGYDLLGDLSRGCPECGWKRAP